MIPITDHRLLTPEEAAQILKISRYTVYKLIERGEIPARRLGNRKIRIDYDSLMQYLQGDSFEKKPAGSVDIDKNADKKNSFTYIGSHDLSIELLKDFLSHGSSIQLQTYFKGSMAGLFALFQREAQFTGIHLWDGESQDYNLPFIKYMLPAENYIVVNLVQRVQGFMVTCGNPLNINSWEDVTRKDLRFVNRQRGSGTRLRFDQFLSVNKILASQIQGYSNEESTHAGVAFKIANGDADVGIGIQLAAQRLGLDFIPLFKERFDLVTLKEYENRQEWQQILKVINSAAFQRAIEQQAGYDISLTGTIVYKN